MNGMSSLKYTSSQILIDLVSASIAGWGVGLFLLGAIQPSPVVQPLPPIDSLPPPIEPAPTARLSQSPWPAMFGEPTEVDIEPENTHEAIEDIADSSVNGIYQLTGIFLDSDRSVAILEYEGIIILARLGDELPTGLLVAEIDLDSVILRDHQREIQISFQHVRELPSMTALHEPSEEISWPSTSNTEEEDPQYSDLIGLPSHTGFGGPAPNRYGASW